ncbi:MAG: hypothetical protein WCM76_15030 [Bacteroidota bacterium]
MKTTGVRVEVPIELYQTLVEIQQTRWQESGKKPSLSAIIIDLCTSGLDSASNNTMLGNNEIKNNPNVSLISNRAYIPGEKRNKQMEQYYCQMDATLNQRALSLRALENELMEARDDFFQKQNEFIIGKEMSVTKNQAGPEQIIELKMSKIELAHKQQTIETLKKEIANNQSIILKSLGNLETSVKKQEKQAPTIWDHIIPWIPVLVNLIGWYMAMGKINGKADLSGLTGHISEVLKGIDPENRQKVSQTIMDAVQNIIKNQTTPLKSASKVESGDAEKRVK